MTPQACTECNRYRKALALILALIARSAGGLVAEIRGVAAAALGPEAKP